jgi:hypothetical protein
MPFQRRMTLGRRVFLVFWLGSTARSPTYQLWSSHETCPPTYVPVISRISRRQTYPTRPVRLIAPFPAGSAADVIGRSVGQWLCGRLGQQVFIENRAGAATNIGTEMAVRAAPDGYTLLLVIPSAATNV